MARPSNQQLFEERKAAAEILDLEPNETLAQGLARREAATQKRLEKLENLLKMQGEALVAYEEKEQGRAVAAIASPAEPADAIKPTSSAPGDFAYYPKPGEPVDPRRAINAFQAEDLGPLMSPVQGDMTPGYVEWVLDKKGPEEVKKRWQGRLHLLSAEIRRAIA